MGVNGLGCDEGISRSSLRVAWPRCLGRGSQAFSVIPFRLRESPCLPQQVTVPTWAHSPAGRVIGKALGFGTATIGGPQPHASQQHTSLLYPSKAPALPRCACPSSLKPSPDHQSAVRHLRAVRPRTPSLPPRQDPRSPSTRDRRPDIPTPTPASHDASKEAAASPHEAGEDANLDSGGRCPSQEDVARAGTKRSLVGRAAGRVKRPRTHHEAPSSSTPGAMVCNPPTDLPPLVLTW